MKNYYEMDLNSLYKKLNTSPTGLSQSEAEERLSENGENVIKQKNKKSVWEIFFNQFKNMMVLLLILVGIVSLVFSIVNHESLVESIVIFGCITVNIIMGFIQDLKSENAVESLKNMTTAKSQVKRDGGWIEIDTKDIVVGDLISLEAGDKVPADARIIKAVNAKVDESILTGESLAVEKDDCEIVGNKLLQDQKNIVFSGTSLVAGKIEAIVIRTSMETELGKIAGTLDNTVEELSPLQVKVKKVSGFIMIIASILVAGTFCYGLITKKDALSLIMLCISMILASVPEVLPVSITSTLTIGVKQMSKKNTIIKQLSAIETLGATQIICSDKTGTITTNKMTVMQIYTNNKNYHDMKTNKKELSFIQKIMGLCNDNVVDNQNVGEFIGDQVDMAFSKYLYNLGISFDELQQTYKRVGDIPFDSTRKMMSCVNCFDSERLLLSKGSVSSILTKCKFIYKNGKIIKLHKHEISKILLKEKHLSKKAYKVIAFAYKPIETKKGYDVDDENGLIFVGLAGLIDPPKDGVKKAVQICKNAKIKPIMITGDSLETAIAVAVEIGIAKDKSQAIEGKAIDGLSDDELASFVKKYTVYARVTPEHKVRIVRAFQSTNKVVAMTGDGVNDAPALKLAHVGIGMGKSGTDVTKNVADIILMDDSFSTIVTAVEEGRRIYSNVIRTIFYNLSSNFTEIFLIIMGMMLFKDIISPLHILYVDIIADTIPSIALAFEKGNKGSMYENPNGLNKRVFTPFMISMLIASALVEFGICMGVFVLTENFGDYQLAQTLTLLTLVVSEYIFTYNCKEMKSFSFKKGLFGNKVLNICFVCLMAIQLPIFLTPLGSIFGIVPINLTQYLMVVTVNVLCFLIIECIKPILAKLFSDK